MLKFRELKLIVLMSHENDMGPDADEAGNFQTYWEVLAGSK